MMVFEPNLNSAKSIKIAGLKCILFFKILLKIVAPIFIIIVPKINLCLKRDSNLLFEANFHK